MSYLRRLFGSTPPAAATASTTARSESVPDLRTIELEGRFYEDVSSSPNGRFTLALTDSSPDGRVFGSRGGG